MKFLEAIARNDLAVTSSCNDNTYVAGILFNYGVCNYDVSGRLPMACIQSSMGMHYTHSPIMCN